MLLLTVRTGQTGLGSARPHPARVPLGPRPKPVYNFAFRSANSIFVAVGCASIGSGRVTRVLDHVIAIATEHGVLLNWAMGRLSHLTYGVPSIPAAMFCQAGLRHVMEL